MGIQMLVENYVTDFSFIFATGLAIIFATGLTNPKDDPGCTDA